MSRESAIAAFQKAATSPPNTQVTPVANPSAVAPEEMGALSVQAPESEGQSITSEATSQAVEPPAAKEEPISQQYAVLARKEKALRAKVQAQEASFKAKEEALAAREAALAAKDSEYKSNYIPKDKITQDTWNTLSELGITYDQVTQEALNQQNQDPRMMAIVRKLESEIQALKGEQENTRKSFSDQQSQAYQQALTQIKSEASDLVASDPAFELIKYDNRVQDVVDLIEQTFKEDGRLLTVEQAAKEVEEYLEEDYLKKARLKKIQDKLKPAAKSTTAAAEKPTGQEQPQQMKTLTNAVSSSRKLSAKERAILAFKGELKSG